MSDIQNPTPAVPAPALSRRWRVVLILSLGFNLLIVGLLAGFAVGGGPDGPFRNVEFAAGPLVEALSDEDRHAIRRDLVRDDRMGRPSAEERRQEFVAVMAAVRAEPFAPEALSAALRSMRDRFSAATEAAEAALVARIAAMSPAERAAFAERLDRALERGRGGHD